MSLTDEQRREGIAGAARERYDHMRQHGLKEANGKPPTYDSCHQRIERAAVAGDLKRQGK